MATQNHPCPTCYFPMVEKPLFTSTYWECPKCSKPKDESDNNRDDEFPKAPWVHPEDYDLIETSTPQPCYSSQYSQKDVHRYVNGAQFCTCGQKQLASPPPYAIPNVNT